MWLFLHALIRLHEVKIQKASIFDSFYWEYDLPFGLLLILRGRCFMCSNTVGNNSGYDFVRLHVGSHQEQMRNVLKLP